MSNNIPPWLHDACPVVVPHLKGILNAKERLKTETKSPLVYSTVNQGIISDVAPHINVLSDKERNLMRKLIIYNYGSSANFYKTRRNISSRALVNLLQSSLHALNQENILVLLLCYRGILECIGQYYFFLKSMDSIKRPSDDYNALLEYLGLVIETAVTNIGGTRINWPALINSQDVGKLIEKRNFKYSSNESMINIEAKSAITGISHLDKKVRGALGVYDILCEFAHPNIGLVLLFKPDANSFIDREDIPWIKNVIDSCAPLSFLGNCSSIFKKIFQVIEDSLDFYLNLDSTAEIQINELRKFTKDFITIELRRKKDLINPYSLCPCNSGNKLKFCCGSTI
jgi:hypothetical protein